MSLGTCLLARPAPCLGGTKSILTNRIKILERMLVNKMAEEPAPPATLPAEFVESLQNLSVNQLGETADYAEALVAHRERERRLKEEEGDKEPEDMDSAERPTDVPSGASVTIKEINDNRYRYWQWRDGEKIKSKYIGPVTSSE